MRTQDKDARQGRKGGDIEKSGAQRGGGKEEVREGGERGRKEECHHGGGHQETRDAVPAAAEVWKGTHTHTHTHTHTANANTNANTTWMSVDIRSDSTHDDGRS